MGAKRFAQLVIVVILSLGLFPGASFASPKHKLFRGVQNVLIFPAEISKHAVQEGMKSKPDFLAPVYGGIYGMLKGGAFAIARGVSGLVDVLTFPVSLPSDWKQAIPIKKFTSEEELEQVSS